MNLSQHIREIGSIAGCDVRRDVPMSSLTSFRIGGPADMVVEPAAVDRLATLIRYLKETAIPFVVLGAGTNVLFRDGGFRGVVIRTAKLAGLHVRENGSGRGAVTAGAGVPLPLVVTRPAGMGFTGLEPLWGIPGSFGGAVATNAGAGGVSIGDFLTRLRLLTRDGEELVLEAADLRCGYRSIALPAGSVVIEGSLSLDKGSREDIEAALERARNLRRTSQPANLPSAGCIFKNPSPDRPAGLIIDRLGLKGESIGGACVSEAHANFIVNSGAATAADVLALVEEIRNRVRQAEGIELELEIQVMGEDR